MKNNSTKVYIYRYYHPGDELDGDFICVGCVFNSGDAISIKPSLVREHLTKHQQAGHPAQDGTDWLGMFEWVDENLQRKA